MRFVAFAAGWAAVFVAAAALGVFDHSKRYREIEMLNRMVQL